MITYPYKCKCGHEFYHFEDFNASLLFDGESNEGMWHSVCPICGQQYKFKPSPIIEL